jgi:hypothetical protein
LKTTIPVPGTLLVALQGLVDDSSTYELRLSYPGTPPTQFAMDLDPREDTGRRLLDSERIIFTATSHGTRRSDWPAADAEVLLGPLRASTRVVRLHATPVAALHPDEARDQWQHCHVVMSLRPVTWGTLPVDTMPLIAFCTVLIPTALAITHWVLMAELHPDVKGFI